MAWFDNEYTIPGASLRIAHFTDTHLFADDSGRYFDVDTAQNACLVLEDMAAYKPDLVIFGGDLTQDHSHQSYRHFIELLSQSSLTCPLFWVPGNHDELSELQAMTHPQIHHENKIVSDASQILLISSKGGTPSGWIDEQHLAELKQSIGETDLPALCICHHHPLPIAGYLDKHILENGSQFLDCLLHTGKVSHVIHGHVHNEYFTDYNGIAVMSTPATSIQFTRHTLDWQQENTGPAWRLIEIAEDGAVTTEVKWLTD